ncbi:MAG: hypothetical protein WCL61_00785 [bacterium]
MKKSLFFVGAMAITSLAIAGSVSAQTPSNFESGRQGNRMNQNAQGPMINGTISTINGTNIVLIGKAGLGRGATSSADIIYNVNVANAVFKQFSSSTDNRMVQTTTTIANIKVGDPVTVRGEISSSSVIAKEVIVGKGIGQGIKKGSCQNEECKFDKQKGPDSKLGKIEKSSSTNGIDKKEKEVNRSETKSGFWSNIFSPVKSLFGRMFGHKNN